MRHDPIGDLVREAFPAHEPTAEELARMRSRYEELTGAPRQAAKGRWAAVAAALVIVLTAGLLIAQRPSRAEAALAAVAASAAQRAPIQIPERSRLYSTETVTTVDLEALVQVTAVREVWRGADGASRVLTRTSSPVRIDPSELVKGVRPPRIDPISSRSIEENRDTSILSANWPTDPTLLEATIRGVGTELDALRAARDILLEPLAPSALRSAVLTVLGRLEPRLVSDSGQFIVLEWRLSEPQKVGFRLSLTRSGEVRTEELILQERTPESDIPSGVVIMLATYESPKVVPEQP